MCRHSHICSRAAGIAVAALLITALAGATAHAQTYGQNPGSPGFVPLASGPIPAGTTGGINNTADADGSVAEDGSFFGFSGNSDFNFEPGRLTLTATNVSDSGLLGFLASFGTLDVTFESLSGMDIRLQSTFDGTTLVATIDFNGGLFADDGDTTNDPNDVPDANPADDNMNTDDNTSDFDSSPGNPFVR